jgi:hypothetical protein
MATEKPKQSQDEGSEAQAGYQQEPNPELQKAALDAIKNLFEAAMQQTQVARPLELGAEAQKAVAAYEQITKGQRVPTKADERWNLPELNETAKPAEKPSASSS